MKRLFALRAPLLLGATALVVAGCVSRKVSAVSAPGSLRIVSFTAEPDTILLSQQSLLRVAVENPNGGDVHYDWTAYQGAIAGQGPEVYYIGSYCCAGTDFIVLTVRNDHDEVVTTHLVMTVIPTE